MSIFDSFLRPSEKDKVKSAEESYNLVKNMIDDQDYMMDMSDHMEYLDPVSKEKIKNSYKFTVRLLSLDFLNKESKDRRVKNVFFTSRHSQPGGSSDSISLRQRIIIEYY